ncbi:hypothetical protein SDRG_13496 [Saprolegnia diclina VS20]|uniref:Uncharacterized protein n=1 Tax=Saprolegnia diclina (strain VS20) TaxID=1156394 RepID=T0Q5U6_SAPDV|nr:hypothetical protein SDRG_13496 [Saprolegnia diclina VS20]EQC28815.1 hypothetical protein SDRG_13496 [Saprolegnia diclina VS20]|eukprot:XP_008617810.1 hypothetical protein SDRG_13496 [Saprolegnia diclina VS20]
MVALVCYEAGKDDWVRLARCPHGVTLAPTSAGWTLLVPSTVPPLLRHLAATDAPGAPLSSPVLLVVAAVVAVTLLAVVAVIGSRCDKRPCRKPRPDVVVVVGSPTAPVSWFHLYQNDDGLPHSILTDDDCTTMILRSSRPSPKDHIVPGSYPDALDEQSISGVSGASVHGWQTPDGSTNSYATVDASFLSLSHALDDEYDYDSRLSER